MYAQEDVFLCSEFDYINKHNKRNTDNNNSPSEFYLRYYIHVYVLALRKLIRSMNMSSRIGQCATVFSILSLFNYPLNETVCRPVRTVDSPIMPFKGIYKYVCVHWWLSVLRMKSIRLEGLTRLVALKNYQLNTGCRAEKLPNEHDLFSQWQFCAHMPFVNYIIIHYF